MAATSAIEWTDATFNPWWGCERVSPACAHCYADTLARRYGFGSTWGADHGFRFFGDKHWAEPLRWNRKAEREGRRIRVFCASMADVFEERDELRSHRDRLFDLIEDTPHLDWQVLTKRPEAALEYVSKEIHAEPYLLPNLWLGVSIENARFSWRADVLREIPAAVRFLSCEPLLGSLFEPIQTRRDGAPQRHYLELDGIDWVIVGGESGPGARPMHPDWAREIRDACLWAPRPGGGADQARHLLYEDGQGPKPPAFFFKQWGEWAPESRHEDYGYVQQHRAHAIRDLGTEQMARIGKKHAGRLLDGRTWDEMPTVAVSA